MVPGSRAEGSAMKQVGRLPFARLPTIWLRRKRKRARLNSGTRQRLSRSLEGPAETHFPVLSRPPRLQRQTQKGEGQ